MLDRLINLPFKIIGKAARAVQERQDAVDRERAEQMTAASRSRSNSPAVEVPDDFETGDLSRTSESIAEMLAQLSAGKLKVLVIDIRAASTYRAGHIPGSLSMPFESLGLDLAELPPLTRFITVCDDVERSRLAARFLRHRGFDDSWFLADGISAWQSDDKRGWS
ncbi:MAG: rhodanese-related sulfurtransferase [Myxococcota bacterium]|jgi:rhodanese-related sulfurtransferase